MPIQNFLLPSKRCICWTLQVVQFRARSGLRPPPPHFKWEWQRSGPVDEGEVWAKERNYQKADGRHPLVYGPAWASQYLVTTSLFFSPLLLVCLFFGCFCTFLLCALCNISFLCVFLFSASLPPYTHIRKLRNHLLLFALILALILLDSHFFSHLLGTYFGRQIP